MDSVGVERVLEAVGTGSVGVEMNPAVETVLVVEMDPAAVVGMNPAGVQCL